MSLLNDICSVYNDFCLHSDFCNLILSLKLKERTWRKNAQSSRCVQFWQKAEWSLNSCQAKEVAFLNTWARNSCKRLLSKAQDSFTKNPHLISMPLHESFTDIKIHCFDCTKIKVRLICATWRRIHRIVSCLIWPNGSIWILGSLCIRIWRF